MYFVCWNICCIQVFNRIANVLHLCHNVILYRSLRRACKRVVAEEGSKTTPEASPPGDPGPSKTKCHRVQQHPAPSKRSEQKQGT